VWIYKGEIEAGKQIDFKASLGSGPGRSERPRGPRGPRPRGAGGGPRGGPRGGGLGGGGGMGGPSAAPAASAPTPSASKPEGGA
jgi:hypothetical protein